MDLSKREANLRGCTWTWSVKKSTPGISNRKRPGYCPWLVIASVYYATPFVSFGIWGWGPRAPSSDRPM
eukprot:3100810-Pyramimonas_sp.AAC.1